MTFPYAPKPGPPPGGFRPGPPPGHRPALSSDEPPGYAADASSTEDAGQIQDAGQAQDAGRAQTQGTGQVRETGHPAVDAVLRSLANAARLAPAEQIAGYEAAHQVLQETLASIDG